MLTPKHPEISTMIGMILSVAYLSNDNISGPWKPTDVLSAEVIQTIFDNNLASPSIELFPEFTEGMKSMSGLCGLPGNILKTWRKLFKKGIFRTFTSDCWWG